MISINSQISFVWTNLYKLVNTNSYFHSISYNPYDTNSIIPSFLVIHKRIARIWLHNNVLLCPDLNATIWHTNLSGLKCNSFLLRDVLIPMLNIHSANSVIYRLPRHRHNTHKQTQPSMFWQWALLGYGTLNLQPEKC